MNRWARRTNEKICRYPENQNSKKNNFYFGESLGYEKMSDYYAKINNKDLAFESLKKSINLKNTIDIEGNKHHFYQKLVLLILQNEDSKQ